MTGGASSTKQGASSAVQADVSVTGRPLGAQQEAPSSPGAANGRVGISKLQILNISSIFGASLATAGASTGLASGGGPHPASNG